jgi:TonB family protein
VKILWKPVPKYSEEGIRRRIEGDVVLLVRFLAQGKAETLQIVSGLGYGLDKYALQAAESIRFEPARQDDQPVDYTAQVRIRFELAY